MGFLVYLHQNRTEILYMPTSDQNVTFDIVAKLWNLCNILKDDGVSYHQYVVELTYLLFLKMAKETGTENQLPKNSRWENLKAKNTVERLDFYKRLLSRLGKHDVPLIQNIFEGAKSFIKKPTTLSTLVDEIDKLDWYHVQHERLGDIYEGLLQKNASESKSGAGQYFTTRPLIDTMVEVMKPTLEDVIQDPAAGTGGFLISANHYILEHNKIKTWTASQKKKYKSNTFYGMEFVQDTHRLALMNLLLHGLGYEIGGTGIQYGDTLSNEGKSLPKASLILTNPPFGTKKGGGLPERTDLTYPTK